MLGVAAKRVQRAQDSDGRSVDVRQGGLDSTPPLHVLRLHRHQGLCLVVQRKL